MKKNETKSDCIYYNWGKTCPREYGAFCTHGKLKWFTRTNGKLKPQCWGCKHYKKEK